MTSHVLYIGDPAYSSWSMRPWLALQRAGIAVDTQLVRLDEAGTRNAIAAVSPAGTVPVLHWESLCVWDSLAICEWAADRSEPGVLWPADPARKALARSVSASMHASFSALRDAAPMNLHRYGQKLKTFDAAASRDLHQLEHVWRVARGAESGDGPFLLGNWSIADAMATPYATRVVSYDLPVSPDTRAYVDALLDTAEYAAWKQMALTDPRRLALVDEM